jgi:hypothetical protein
MLSTTFSTIVANATAEIQFRRAVLTLEGVKSDAIFAYQPPFNILALFVLTPLKFILTPRWFHKINVAAVRVINAPLLLLISLIERRILWAGARHRREAEQLPKAPSRANLWDFSRGFSAHGDIQAVFDAEPTQPIEEEITNNDDLGRRVLEDEFAREFGPEAGAKLSRRNTGKSRRDSVAPFAAITGRLKTLVNEGSNERDEENVKTRLEGLEKTMLRIEKMLQRLCEGLGGGVAGGASVDAGGAGTFVT